MPEIKILKKVDSVSFARRFHIGTYLVELPDGSKTHFYLRHSDHFAIVIPVLENGDLIMVRQYRIGAKKLSLEFVMGEVYGKSSVEAAPIELKEESGYTAETIEKIGSFYVSPGWSDQVGDVFVATNLTEGEQELEQYEFIEVERVSPQQVEDYIENGTIFDSSTIIAFSFFKKRYLTQ